MLMSVGTGNVLFQTLASLLQEKQLHVCSREYEGRQYDMGWIKTNSVSQTNLIGIVVTLCW